MYKMASLLANPVVQKAGKAVLGTVADKATSGIFGGIGGAIGGNKGKRIGKSIAKGLGSVRKAVLGFDQGGKVRRVPMRITGHNAGGVILEPVVRPLPRPARRRRK